MPFEHGLAVGALPRSPIAVRRQVWRYADCVWHGAGQALDSRHCPARETAQCRDMSLSAVQSSKVFT